MTFGYLYESLLGASKANLPDMEEGIAELPPDQNLLMHELIKSNTLTEHFLARRRPLAPAMAQRGVRNVCVIGGGVSGIVTARVLIEEGVDVTLYEAEATLGGVWRENYTGFGIQVPSALYEFPDCPLPPKGWDFCSGPSLSDYVNMYAKRHGVWGVTSLKTKVKEIQRSGENGYRVTVEGPDGWEQCRHFDLVLVATGVYGQRDKFIPDWKGKESFNGQVLHSVDFTDAEICKGKHVIVVGFGKSGFDCAQVCSKAGKSSTLLFRKAHWCVPRKILGLIPFEYATFSRLGGAILLPKWPDAGPFECIVHFIPGLLNFVWWFVSVVFSMQFGILFSELKPTRGFMEDFWGCHGILPDPGFFKAVRKGDIKAVKGEIVEMKPKSVVLQSGEVVPCDLVIAATGFLKRSSFLPPEIAGAKEKDGLWLYRNMINPDHPRLVFVNSETTTFTNITTASIQARWLAEALAGSFELPSPERMREEITRMKAFKRCTMPHAGPARACMIQTHQVHYYDTLLKDMGASIRRKRGWPITRAIKEIFDPYRPRDYDTIVTGEFKYLPEESAHAAEQRAFWPECFLFLLDCAMAYVMCAVLCHGARGLAFEPLAVLRWQ